MLKSSRVESSVSTSGFFHVDDCRGRRRTRSCRGIGDGFRRWHRCTRQVSEFPNFQMGKQESETEFSIGCQIIIKVIVLRNGIPLYYLVKCILAFQRFVDRLCCLLFMAISIIFLFLSTVIGSA